MCQAWREAPCVLFTLTILCEVTDLLRSRLREEQAECGLMPVLQLSTFAILSKLLNYSESQIFPSNNGDVNYL